MAGVVRIALAQLGSEHEGRRLQQRLHHQADPGLEALRLTRGEDVHEGGRLRAVHRTAKRALAEAGGEAGGAGIVSLAGLAGGELAHVDAGQHLAQRLADVEGQLRIDGQRFVREEGVRALPAQRAQVGRGRQTEQVAHRVAVLVHRQAPDPSRDGIQRSTPVVAGDRGRLGCRVWHPAATAPARSAPASHAARDDDSLLR